MLFPYVEAGYGHIMPLRSMEQKFREKYGDRVEVISSQFYTESREGPLIRYQRMLGRQVRAYNRVPALGYLVTIAGELGGTGLSSLAAIRLLMPRAFRAGVAHMSALRPDAVFSTHWATNYYARHMKEEPLTVMYCPDVQLNKLFRYPCDLCLISIREGYDRALRSGRYGPENLRLVPFLIREEAFSVCGDRRELRRRLGLPEDKFTVLLAEGGYGIGKMEAITRRLVREHLPLTVVPVCGTNEALYRRLQALEPAAEVTFRPFGFTERMPELEAAADVFCGKSSNTVAEVAFFGNPSVVTNCTSLIERQVADHYIRRVGCALKQLSPKKTVALIRRFAGDPTLLEPYRRAAGSIRDQFGAEAAADALWEMLTARFPALRDE